MEKPHAEEEIWRPISEHPDALGFHGAAALNHLQMGDQSGYIDLVLFPTAGPSLVLIEAKHAGDASVDRANPAINRHRKTGHFVAVIETGEFYCEAAS